MKRQKWAMIIAVNNAAEHNTTIVYRSIFLGETLTLINRLDGWRATPHDLLIDQLNLTDFLSLFAEEPDLVLFWGDVHQSQLLKQLARQLKKTSPSSAAFVFGRSSTFIPQYFKRPPFDAVHVSGDREATILDFIDYLDGNRTIHNVAGIAARAEGTTEFVENPGRFLAVHEWPFPSLDDLPINRYKEYVLTQYGETYSQRVSATVAKGCTWNCSYCGATQEEGRLDRRRAVDVTFDWINKANLQSHDCYLHLYSPNLFHDQGWIRSFCEAYNSNGSQFGWRGVTTTTTLQDDDIVTLAAQSGCRELAIGVEHISAKNLKPAKSSLDALTQAAKICLKTGIKLKGLVMLGYPEQSEEDVEFMIKYLTDRRMTIRFTGYTPLQSLTTMTASELDSLPLEDYDRRTFFDEANSKLPRKLFYSLLTQNGGYIHA